MCLILFAYQKHPDYPLIMLSNRDEFFNRPSQAAHFWPDLPDIFAGRDQEAAGTWLGINKNGRIAAVTNFRETLANPAQPQSQSRGELTTRFLQGNQHPNTYLQNIDKQQHRYSGFNLLVGSFEQLYYYSNRQRLIQQLPRGIHGLSNGLLNSPWPKVDTGKAALRQHLELLDRQALINILLDSQQPDDALLPNTGIGIEAERMLGSRFISSEHYGTRAATLLLIDKNGDIDFIEQTFLPDGSKGQIIEQRIHRQPPSVTRPL